MKKQHILIFLIAICAQLSAFGSILENDNVVKGIAKLNGKDIGLISLEKALQKLEMVRIQLLVSTLRANLLSPLRL